MLDAFKVPISDRYQIELAEKCAIEASDVVVSMVTNSDEGWFFGHGRAQFLTGEL